MQTSFVCRTTKSNLDSINCHSGFLQFEEVEGSGLFVRRFFVLNQQSGRLEYFMDDRSVRLVLCTLVLINWSNEV